VVKALFLKNEQEVIDQMERIVGRRKGGIAHSRPLLTELMYKGQRILQIVRGMDRKMQQLEFWRFLKIFVRDLYANQAIVEFDEFQAFSVSVT
jgi:hypothetical protein